MRPFSGTTFEFVEGGEGATAGQLRKGLGCATPYIHNTVVISFGSREEHERLLTMVLEALNEARIQRAECEFFRVHAGFLGRADFLGHSLFAAGNSQRDSKVAAINNWPPS